MPDQSIIVWIGLLLILTILFLVGNCRLSCGYNSGEKYRKPPPTPPMGTCFNDSDCWGKDVLCLGGECIDTSENPYYQ